jgi:VWFA-related protein
VKVLFSLFLTIALSYPVLAQEQVSNKTFGEQLDVNLVLVDVTVTDRNGNQILGLDRNDFTVTENGKAQNIESLDYFTNRRLLSAPESQAAFKVERVREERNFILFFDKPLDPSWAPQFRSELLSARRAAEDFIDERLQPQDRVAIAGFDARLKIFSDFTSDRKALKDALVQATSFSNGLKEGSGPIMKEINPRKMIKKTGTAYDAIRVLSDAVQPILGRKVLVLFSPGIGEQNMSQNFQNEDRYYQPMIQALNRSNVTVYSVGMKAPYRSMEDTLSRMASETGGEFFRSPVNYRIPLTQMERTNNGYYLLSYYSNKPKDKHGYQKIDVDVKNSEFRVKAREGYPY